MKRRTFVKRIGTGTVLLGAAGLPTALLGGSAETLRLCILHTNDVHSRIDPFDSGQHAGKGGAARRATMIDQIRSEQEHVLLLDAGDIFQGTPYFNYFDGELELKLMSEMGYDAATMGNHDFDAGIDGFARQLQHANFPFLCSNYDFSDTPLSGRTEAYRVFEKGGLRIGVFGLGIALQGLVPDQLFGNTRYLDPVEWGQRTATTLKREENCDYVICLSHLGYNYASDVICDVKLAKQTYDIDLIIGGHTHTFMPEPDIVKNAAGEATLINQVGWAGIILGRVDVLFERNRRGQCIHCENLLVGSV